MFLPRNYKNQVFFEKPREKKLLKTFSAMILVAFTRGIRIFFPAFFSIWTDFLRTVRPLSTLIKLTLTYLRPSKYAVRKKILTWCNCSTKLSKEI